MTVRKFLDLSTAHLCPGTRDWLDKQGVIAAAARTSADPEPALLVGSTQYGWLVYADSEACSDTAKADKLLDRRNDMNNGFGIEPRQDGLRREAIEKLDREIAALTTDPGKMPSDLWSCMAMARAMGCEYILFDADAPEFDGLPTFEEPTARARTQESAHVH